MQRPRMLQPVVLVLLVLLQALGVFAASLKTSYTLAYVPVTTTSAKPTPFAVLVSQPVPPAPPPKAPKNKRQGKSTAPAAAEPPKELGPVFSFESYTPPKKESASKARIGLLATSGKVFNGSTTLASLAALQDPFTSTLYVQLDLAGVAQGVSLRAFEKQPVGKDSANQKENKKPGKKSGKKSGKKDGDLDAGKDVKNSLGPAVELVHAAAEPRPILNRPVVLNAEGKVDEVPQEKTLLQRFWWVGLLVVLFSVMGGGGEQK